MGTLGIIGTLLFHIQGESNPIYLAERRSANILPRLNVSRWGGCAFILLLLAFPILSFFEGRLNLSPSVFRDVLFTSLLVLVGGVLSVGWTVPLAALAGQGISRERSAQTWGTLLVTPFPTETILMAKGAASVQRVWKIVISLALIASLPGIFIAGPIMLAITLATGRPIYIAVILMLVAIVAIVAEREQEIALSFVVGLAAAFLSDSRRLTLLFGLIGGLIIRLFQALITILLLAQLSPQSVPNAGLLNAVAGTSTLITAAASSNGEYVTIAAISAGIVIGMIVLREVLIRGLFAWTVRRAREE